ncbi:MAG: hypothetical protein WCV85_06315 [Patescibacteria group bacterium]|jgi:hypothetical protein
MRGYVRIAVVVMVALTIVFLSSLPAAATHLTEAQLMAEPLDTGMVIQFDQVEMVRFEPRIWSDRSIGVVFLYTDSTTEDGKKVRNVYRYDIDDTSTVWVIFNMDDNEVGDNTASVGLHDVNRPNEAFGRRSSPEKRLVPTLYINLTDVERAISLFQKLPGVFLLNFSD